MKLNCGLDLCQCRTPQSVVKHVAFVMLTYVIFHQLKLTPSETVGEVKERWQLRAIRAGHTPPKPLKAKPKKQNHNTA